MNDDNEKLSIEIWYDRETAWNIKIKNPLRIVDMEVRLDGYRLDGVLKIAQKTFELHAYIWDWC